MQQVELLDQMRGRSYPLSLREIDREHRRSPSVYWGVTRSPVIRGDGYLFVCDFGESVVRVIGETLARQINDEEMLLQKSRETCPDLICPFCLGETDFLNYLIPTAFLFRIILVAWTKKWFNIK